MPDLWSEMMDTIMLEITGLFIYILASTFGLRESILKSKLV
jgi:hypothetical protein